MKILGFVMCAVSAVLVLSIVAVPIQGWPGTAPFDAYLRPVGAWVPCLLMIGASGAVLAEPRALIGAPGRALAVAVLGVAMLWPAFALAQDAAAATPTMVNLGDVFRDFRDTIVTLIGAVVALIVGVIAAAVRKSTGLSIDAKMRESLQSAAMNGVHFGLDRVQDIADRTSIDVKSRIIAEGVQYIRQYAPKAIAHFKLGEGDLEAIARAKLAELQPAAVKAAKLAGA